MSFYIEKGVYYFIPLGSRLKTLFLDISAKFYNFIFHCLSKKVKLKIDFNDILRGNLSQAFFKATDILLNTENLCQVAFKDHLSVIESNLVLYRHYGFYCLIAS